MSRGEGDYRNTMLVGLFSSGLSLVPVILAWKTVQHARVEGASWTALLTFGGAVLLFQTILLAVSLFVVLPEGGVGLSQVQRIRAGLLWLGSILISVLAITLGLLVSAQA